MRKLIYIVTIICLSIPGLLLAQQTEMDNRQQFALAESEYQVGHIDSAIDMLNQHINTYSGTLKVSAYRLLALCSLAQDDLTNANKYVDLLLKEDPYYSISINDPERFAELIRNKKEGKTTLV
ncbi:tetratricopeptide repeat protein, partial [Parabacteroides sp.]